MIIDHRTTDWSELVLHARIAFALSPGNLSRLGGKRREIRMSLSRLPRYFEIHPSEDLTRLINKTTSQSGNRRERERERDKRMRITNKFYMYLLHVPLFALSGKICGFSWVSRMRLVFPYFLFHLVS